ncbi:MAG: hypothetical protein J2P57_12555 [Acidimicrobiaceae bacterium]|nr:hypothetical protein [Acidimicrobiaceae bacterium]
MADRPREQVAGDATLPGEDPASRLLDDLEHWSHVYEELATTLAALIQQQEREEGASGYLARLQAQLEHAQERLRYWRQRIASFAETPAYDEAARAEAEGSGGQRSD